MQLHSLWKRKQIYQARSKLKDTSIYLAENLTRQQHQCCMLRKSRVITSTWTYDCTIYIRTRDGEQHAVETEDDLKRLKLQREDTPFATPQTSPTPSVSVVPGSALKPVFTEQALSNCLRSQKSPPPRASKCPLTAAAKIVTTHQSKIYHQSNCVAWSQDTRERTRLTIMDKSKCSVCFRNILSHACRLTCCVCKYDVHLNCIPFVDKKNSIYMEREHNQWFCIKCIEDIFPFNHCNDDDDQSVTKSGTY